MIQMLRLAEKGVLADNDERGAGHWRSHTQTLCNALRETRLARAEIPLEADHVARLQQGRQTLAQQARLKWAKRDDCPRARGATILLALA